MKTSTVSIEARTSLRDAFDTGINASHHQHQHVTHHQHPHITFSRCDGVLVVEMVFMIFIEMKDYITVQFENCVEDYPTLQKRIVSPLRTEHHH